jgi:tetratricopeptide (TPR) repeat protein
MNDFKLNSEVLLKIKYDTIEMLFNLDEKTSCFDKINEIYLNDLSDEQQLKLSKFKISCLISLGRGDEAREIMDDIFKKNDGVISDDLMLEKIMLEFETGNENEAELLITNLFNICTNKYYLARAFHVKGNIFNIYRRNYKEAIRYYNSAINIYEEINEQLMISKIKHNIGTQYYLAHQYESALKEWKEAEILNKNIGNLDQEGLINSNFGNYYYDKFQTETAEEYFKNAISIFKITGNKKRLGMVQHNYILLSLKLCQYDSVIKRIEKCKQIFSDLAEMNELAELYFTEAKFCFETGQYKKLLFIVDIYEELINTNQIPKYHEVNITLIHLLVKYCNNSSVSEDEVSLILEQYFNSDNIGDLIFTLSFLFINLKKPNNTIFIKYNNEQSVQEHCKLNFLDNITMDYLHTYLLNSKNNYAEALNILENNYNVLNDRNINEQTWKYTFRLGEEYLRRGNKQQALEYIQLTKSLISHIADQFKEFQDRKAYLNDKNRFSVLEQIRTWEKYFYAV